MSEPGSLVSVRRAARIPHRPPDPLGASGPTLLLIAELSARREAQDWDQRSAQLARPRDRMSTTWVQVTGPDSVLQKASFGYRCPGRLAEVVRGSPLALTWARGLE